MYGSHVPLPLLLDVDWENVLRLEKEYSSLPPDLQLTALKCIKQHQGARGPYLSVIVKGELKTLIRDEPLPSVGEDGGFIRRTNRTVFFYPAVSFSQEVWLKKNWDGEGVEVYRHATWPAAGMAWVVHTDIVDLADTPALEVKQPKDLKPVLDEHGRFWRAEFAQRSQMMRDVMKTMGKDEVAQMFASRRSDKRK